MPGIMPSPRRSSRLETELVRRQTVPHRGAARLAIFHYYFEGF